MAWSIAQVAFVYLKGGKTPQALWTTCAMAQSLLNKKRFSAVNKAPCVFQFVSTASDPVT